MISQRRNISISELRRRSGEVASILKQLSHPQRLLVLCSLADGEKSVGQIEEACDTSQSAVSQFLKGMRLEGMIQARRAGKQIYYRIIDRRILKLMRELQLIFCK